MVSKRAIGGALLVCALIQAALQLSHDQKWLVIGAGCFSTLLAIAAATGHAVNAVRQTGSSRAAWWFTSAATATWAVGSAFYTVDAINDNFAMPPRIGDWFALFAVAVAPGVLLAGPSAPVSRDIQVRLLMDGIMVATALFVPAWPLLLKPTWVIVGNTGSILAVGIPSMHIMCLAISIVLLSRSRSNAINAVTALAAAFTLFATSVLTYLALALNGGPWQVHSIAGALSAATVMLFFAAWVPMPTSSRPWLEAPTGKRAALPYVPVVVAFLVAGVLQRRNELDGTLIVAILIILALVLTRQYLALNSAGRLVALVEAQKEQLAHQAGHDELTGLANRKLLNARLADAVASGRPVALLLVDLDGFKQVNDRFGHGAGDQVLIAVATALHRTVPADALSARLGGDEFAILLHPATSADDAVRLGERVIAEIVHGCEPRVGASVGVAYETGPDRTEETLLVAADTALYEGKRAGKGVAVLARPGVRPGSDGYPQSAGGAAPNTGATGFRREGTPCQSAVRTAGPSI